MYTISSDTFIKVIKGDEKTRELHKRFYVPNDYNDEIHVCFKDTVVTGEVLIKEEFNYPYFIKINQCTFINRIDFWKGTFEKGISAESTSFKDRVYITNGVYKWIRIAKCSFVDFLAIGGIGNPGEFGSITIEDVSAKSLLITGGHFKSLSFRWNKVKHIVVSNRNTFINSLSFSSPNKIENSKVSISNILINKLYFSGEYLSSNYVEVENIDLHSIRFNDFINKGKFLLKNIRVNAHSKQVSDLTISEFYIKENVSEDRKSDIQSYTSEIIDESLPLYKLHLPLNDSLIEEKEKLLLIDENDQKDSYFGVDKATLGELEMKKVEMNKFNELTIFNTDLSTIKLYSSTFPCKKITGDSAELYEVFNDLYTVSQSQNNKRDQIEYYKYSKNALLNSMLNKHWFKNIPSIISLGLSWIYSDFGTKWIRALFIVTPLLGALFFTLMMLLTKYDLDISNHGFENFKMLLAYYIRFLNPAHRINFMDNIFSDFIFSNNFIFVLLDTFGRIFIGIGLFETVQSFRSYSRK
jgi:hypothetical protein